MRTEDWGRRPRTKDRGPRTEVDFCRGSKTEDWGQRSSVDFCFKLQWFPSFWCPHIKQTPFQLLRWLRQSLWPDSQEWRCKNQIVGRNLKSDTGQHSQFLRCFFQWLTIDSSAPHSSLCPPLCRPQAVWAAARLSGAPSFYGLCHEKAENNPRPIFHIRDVHNNKFCFIRRRRKHKPIAQLIHWQTVFNFHQPRI